MLTAHLDVRTATERDAETLRELRRAEGAGQAALRALGSALPDASRTWVAEREGRALASVTSVSLPTFVEGRVRSFGRLGEPLVDEDLPRAERLRVSVELLRRVLDERCAPTLDVVVFAFLDSYAWRMAERELGFEQVGHECALVLAPGLEPSWTVALGCATEVEEVAAFDEQALWLHERCAGDWGASSLRDATFLRARLGSAAHETRVFGVRDMAGILRGQAIVEQHEHTLDLLDLLVPVDEVDVGRALLARTVAEAGHRVLRASLPAWSPWFARFQEWGFRVRVGPRILAARSAARRLDLFWLRDHWWHQPLETGALQVDPELKP